MSKYNVYLIPTKESARIAYDETTSSYVLAKLATKPVEYYNMFVCTEDFSEALAGDYVLTWDENIIQVNEFLYRRSELVAYECGGFATHHDSDDSLIVCSTLENVGYKIVDSFILSTLESFNKRKDVTLDNYEVCCPAGSNAGMIDPEFANVILSKEHFVSKLSTLVGKEVVEPFSGHYIESLYRLGETIGIEDLDVLEAYYKKLPNKTNKKLLKLLNNPKPTLAPEIIQVLRSCYTMGLQEITIGSDTYKQMPGSKDAVFKNWVKI